MLVAFPVNATVWKALKVDIIPSALRTELLKVDSRIYVLHLSYVEDDSNSGAINNFKQWNISGNQAIALMKLQKCLFISDWRFLNSHDTEKLLLLPTSSI